MGLDKASDDNLQTHQSLDSGRGSFFFGLRRTLTTLSCCLNFFFQLVQVNVNVALTGTGTCGEIVYLFLVKGEI